MIGVNVLVKGTTNGTITDFDGKFSIPDVPSNATLVVSYIGYLTKEVKIWKRFGQLYWKKITRLWMKSLLLVMVR